MNIRKWLLLAFLSLLLLSATACGTIISTGSKAITTPDVTVCPSAATPNTTTTPSVTMIPTPEATPALTSPDITNSAEADTPVISPTATPVQYEYYDHSVESHNGKSMATAHTKIEVYNGGYNGWNEIIDKITIQNNDNNFEINDLIGYYSDMSWSPDDTKLVVSYYGRTWSNFSIFNAVDATPIYSEISFDTIRSYFEGKGTVFNFKNNESRPDTQIIFQEWSEDSKSIKVKYSTIDTDWQTQSGTFWYDLGTGEMRDIEQNSPYEDG